MPRHLRRFSSFTATTTSISFSSSPSISTLLKRCKTLHHLNQLHGRIIYKGLEQDHCLISQFISIATAVFNLSFSYSTSVFNRVLSPNTFLWNVLIRTQCDDSRFLDTIMIFIRMKREEGVPDAYTYPSVIKACANELKVREGRSFHGMSVRSGVDGDLFVGTSLIDMYGKYKQIEWARKVFDEMRERSVVSWTAMVVAYTSVWDLIEAKKVFEKMPYRNVASWNAIISGYVKLSDLRSARTLFDEMPVKNVVSFTTMINGYAKAGEMESARVLFNQAPEKDKFAWSALISGYAQNGQPNEAIKVFLEMNSKNVKPDEFVLVSLMSACSRVGNLDLVEWVDSYINQSSININNAHVLAALIDMNAKCGNMERATNLFEKMERRDLISYCSMIQGLSIHGQGTQAVNLFKRMLNEGLTPDEVAFTVILTACSHAGLVDDGWNFFEIMMKRYSIVPSCDHYACIVDLLSRSGRLTMAYELIKSMPMEPNACSWGALLGACKLYSNIELGEMVANRLLEIEPGNAGNYVLLSNIYAASERWLDVSLVRSRMKERGVRKIPGCSWV